MPVIEAWTCDAKGVQFYLTMQRGIKRLKLDWPSVRGQATKVVGHAMTYYYYTGLGFAGVVTPIPSELHLEGSSRNNGGRWLSTDQQVSFDLSATAAPPTAASCQRQTADQEQLLRSEGWQITNQQSNGGWVTLTGHQQNNRQLLLSVQYRCGKSGAIRAKWSYPAETSPWVNQWINQQRSMLHHKPLG
jgi:hypothetical protein